MSSVVISGDTSGAITVTAPAVAGTYTQTLPMITGTLGTLNSGTAVASTSGTSIGFTSIPAGVRRITVMFQGVSTSGSSAIQVQIGSGSYTTSGYSGVVTYASSVVGSETRTTGLPVMNSSGQASDAVINGLFVVALQTGNTWVSSCTVGKSGTTNLTCFGGGSIALSGVLDRIQVTTVNGTDTFDAGSINILYE